MKDATQGRRDTWHMMAGVAPPAPCQVRAESAAWNGWGTEGYLEEVVWRLARDQREEFRSTENSGRPVNRELRKAWTLGEKKGPRHRGAVSKQQPRSANADCAQALHTALNRHRHNGPTHPLSELDPTSQAALVLKNSAANAGDRRDMGSIPGSGRPPGGRVWQSTPAFFPGEAHGQRSLAVHRITKSRTRLSDLVQMRKLRHRGSK